MLPSTVPAVAPDDETTSDHLGPFRNAILAVRASATLATIALSTPGFIDGDLEVVLLCAIGVGYSVLRIMYPIRFRSGDWRLHVPLAAEAVFTVLIVLLTGFWDSPFIFLLSTAIVVIAFARGFTIAVRISLLIAGLVTVPDLLLTDTIDSVLIRSAIQWTLWLVLLSFVAGHARKATGDAIRRHTIAIDRLDRLADANRLLHSLHEITQTLPASLDLEEVVRNGADRLAALFDPDAFALLLIDEPTGSWTVIRRDGGSVAAVLDTDDLPPGLRTALTTERAVITGLDGDRPGLFDDTASGLYIAMRARDEVIGLIALEANRRAAFEAADRDVLHDFVKPVALAIDNARWFGRLRTVGADEERTRIARDLHDRVGQSIAYLAFELDRIMKLAERDEPHLEQLAALRGDVRDIVGEMRETLYDLRTDISESTDPVGLLEGFMERVAQRSGIETSVRSEIVERPPPLRERELWRIAQEAITNAERHARASRIAVTWRTDHNSATIEIADDGVGFDTAGAGRVDSYGIRGMRERAASIGAVLDIRPGDGAGTVVHCTIDDGRNGSVTG